MAWRSVEREMPSWEASSRSGGRRVPAPSRPSLIALPSRSTVSSNVVGGETGSNTPATPSVLSIGQRYPLRAISSKSSAAVVHVGGQRPDHRLEPGALVVARAAQAPPRPLDHVVAPAQGERGAGDRVATVREDGERSRMVTADAQDVHHRLAAQLVRATRVAAVRRPRRDPEDRRVRPRGPAGPERRADRPGAPPLDEPGHRQRRLLTDEHVEPVTALEAGRAAR